MEGADMPSKGDGAVDVTSSTPPTGKGIPMDPTIKALLEQNMAKWTERSEQDHRLMTGANSNIAEQTRLDYLRSIREMGIREAEALRRSDHNKLANDILAQRSARDQPQAGTT